MNRAEVPHPDLESFQRWAIALDDQLTAAVHAVLALEEGDDSDTSAQDESALLSARSTGDLVDELVEEIATSEKAKVFIRDRYGEPPSWFGPVHVMAMNLGDWVYFLMDYIEEHREEIMRGADSLRTRLVHEAILPALEHWQKFFAALNEAGHLDREADNAS